MTPVVLAATDEPDGPPYGGRWTAEQDDTSDRGMFGRGGGPGQGQGAMAGRGQGQPGQGHGMARGGGPGQGMGPGMGQGMGPGQAQGRGTGPGQGLRGDGDCLLDGTAAQGELTDAQKALLAENAETEKMSHDLYVAFFDAHGDYRFERVAQAETQHLEALRMLMDRYDVTDPTVGLDEGEFASDEIQADYDAYLEQGAESLEAALEVAADYERADIAGLEEFADDVTDAADVDQVLGHLADGSRMHLEAFSR